MAWFVLFYVGIGITFASYALDAYIQDENDYRDRADAVGGPYRLAVLSGVFWPGVVHYWIKGKRK